LEAKEADKSQQDEVLMSAAISLICEWAQRVLMRQFDTVVDLARFLVKEHLISPRTKNAALVMEELLTENMLQSQKDPKTRQTPKNAGQESEVKTADPQPKQTEPPKGTAAAPPGGKEDRPVAPRAKQTTAADVDSVINRYPPIWPKAQVKKVLAISPAPCIGPAAVPVRMGTTVPLALPPGSNSGGVVSTAPLPLLKKVTVILPRAMQLPGPEAGGAALTQGLEPAAGRKSEGAAGCNPPKGSAAAPHTRPAGSPGDRQAPKRKRGRPRKFLAPQRPPEREAGSAARVPDAKGVPEAARLPPQGPPPHPAPEATPSPRLSPPAPSALPSVTDSAGEPPSRKSGVPSEPGARKTSVIRPVWWTGTTEGRRTRSPTHTTPADTQ
ncbi:uncharacterized protein LOC144489056, partial [Mustelus asterias]